VILAPQRFADGPTPDGEDWPPNVKPAGLGHWSKDNIAWSEKDIESKTASTRMAIMWAATKDMTSVAVLEAFARRVHRLRQHGAGASGGIEQEQSCCGRAAGKGTD
jgi:hypothetical protein